MTPVGGELLALPSGVGYTSGWNTTSFLQDPVTTDGANQYAAYVDQNSVNRVAKRTSGGAWSSQSLAATAIGTPVNDAHHGLSIAVSGNGHVHIAGNVHNTALRYIRTTTPGDISAWSSPGMVGSDETSVTYPQFVRLSNGDLLFFYRTGSGTNGSTILNRYNNTGTWSRVATLIQGGTNLSPYLHRVAVNPTTGRLHVMWAWATGVATADNIEDLCYAYSDDSGTTWRNSAGTAYTLPITRAAAEVALDVASGGGMLNQNGLDVDTSGRPHAAVLLYDAGGKTQIRHVWHNGTAWVNTQVTTWTYRMALNVANPDFYIARPAVACTSTGKVFIIARSRIDTPRRVVAFDVTPGQAQRQVDLVYELFDERWEPCFDSRALAGSDLLVMPAFNWFSSGLASINLGAI